MSEGREGRRFFVSFYKKRKEGASCFGSFLKRRYIFRKAYKHTTITILYGYNIKQGSSIIRVIIGEI